MIREESRIPAIKKPTEVKRGQFRILEGIYLTDDLQVQERFRDLK